MIANYKPNNRWSVLGLSLITGLAVLTFTEAQSPGSSAAEKPAPAENKTAAPQDGPPRIVFTSPKIGETDVDPALEEITVTFDRDMAAGFSWTGGGPDFPIGRDGQKIHWRDKRTCAFPVKLESGHYYRVGLNSSSAQNFRSATGVPARPSALYFTTKGASDGLKLKTQKPQIIAMTPANGATDVDPATKELRVTFNVPMKSGFSWTGGPPQFPAAPEGKKPYWSEDHKTCFLPAELKPSTEYRLGLNSPSHKNFQSTAGVPLDPLTYTFKTKSK
jgi:hypothetical protein